MFILGKQQCCASHDSMTVLIIRWSMLHWPLPHCLPLQVMACSCLDHVSSWCIIMYYSMPGVDRASIIMHVMHLSLSALDSASMKINIKPLTPRQWVVPVFFYSGIEKNPRAEKVNIMHQPRASWQFLSKTTYQWVVTRAGCFFCLR